MPDLDLGVGVLDNELDSGLLLTSVGDDLCV